MSLSILSLLALAAVAPAIFRIARGSTGWLLAIAPLTIAVYFGAQLSDIAAGETVQEAYAWVPSLSLALSFRLDGLILLFALLITGMGSIVLVYTGGYLAGHPQIGRMYALLLLFMASMLGLVLADNLLALFVFWELTSVSSYLLIGFNHDRPAARAAALQALLVTGSGGLALMAGLLLLGSGAGSMELSTLLDATTDFRSHPYYLPALVLILIGAFTKSAQFPFHFWLPGAMEAPTPVSAYLHSATMVKAGIYLLARLSPILGGTEVWVGSVSTVGGVTMLVGGFLALSQTDLKRILAYSTVSVLGMLTLMLGLGGTLAIQAAMVLLLGHALYKGALFLVAGAVDHETGTRDITQLGGLVRRMPITAVAAAVAALSMTGVAPLFGFIAKELFYEATLASSFAIWLTAVVVLANVLVVVAAILAGLRPFWGTLAATPHQPHEPPPSLWLGISVLGVLSIAFGIYPMFAAQDITASATQAALGQTVDLKLALWHGWNTSLAFSAGTLVVGIAAFTRVSQIRVQSSKLSALGNWGPERAYLLALKGLNALAAGQTRFLQSGYLRYYLLIILATLVTLVGGTLISRNQWSGIAEFAGVPFYEIGLAVLILLATGSAILAKSRLAAIASLGVVGYAVALVFVFFGAPDVAMTQFLIETLTVILFVLVFYHLPETTVESPVLSRWRDGLLAISVGVLMMGMVLVADALQHSPSISRYYLEHSATAAHGRNIVNVILVDFRGLDTLGEITVLAVAGIGVYSLLRLSLGSKAKQNADTVESPPKSATAERERGIS